MSVLWHIWLTVCLGSECHVQDVQWFENESQCKEMVVLYRQIPQDGNWDRVNYICKPVGSTGT